MRGNLVETKNAQTGYTAFSGYRCCDMMMMVMIMVMIMMGDRQDEDNEQDKFG